MVTDFELTDPVSATAEMGYFADAYNFEMEEVAFRSRVGQMAVATIRRFLLFIYPTGTVAKKPGFCGVMVNVQWERSLPANYRCSAELGVRLPQFNLAHPNISWLNARFLYR